VRALRCCAADVTRALSGRPRGRCLISRAGQRDGHAAVGAPALDLRHLRGGLSKRARVRRRGRCSRSGRDCWARVPLARGCGCPGDSHPRLRLGCPDPATRCTQSARNPVRSWVTPLAQSAFYRPAAERAAGDLATPLHSGVLRKREVLSAASQRAQQARGGRAPLATEYGARRWRLLHRAHQRCGTPPRSTAEHAQCAGHRHYFRWSLLTSCVAQPSTLHQGRGCVQSTSRKAQVWYRGFATPRHLRRAVRLRPGAPVVELRQSCQGAEQRTGVLSHSECNVVLTASALLGLSTVSSAEADASGYALIRKRLCSAAWARRQAHQVQAGVPGGPARTLRALAIV